MNSLRDQQRAERFVRLVYLKRDLEMARVPPKMPRETIRDLLANWPRDPLVCAAVMRSLRLPVRTSPSELTALWVQAPAIPLGYSLGYWVDEQTILHLVLRSPLPCDETPSWVVSHAIRVMLDKQRFCSREWLGIEQLKMTGLQWWLCGVDDVWNRVDYSVMESAMNRIAIERPAGCDKSTQRDGVNPVAWRRARDKSR